MKVLVCGGRTYENDGILNLTLDAIHAALGIDLIVHGDAGKFYEAPISSEVCGFWVGADKMAAQWARQHNVPEKFYKPDWGKYGKKGGPIRNQQMLDENPDIALVVAFPGGRGTADMVKRAKAGGYKVCEVGES